MMGNDSATKFFNHAVGADFCGLGREISSPITAEARQLTSQGNK